jgi:hypothetical protein
MCDDFTVTKISRIDLRLMGIDNAGDFTDEQMKAIASVAHRQTVNNGFLDECIRKAVRVVIDKERED